MICIKTFRQVAEAKSEEMSVCLYRKLSLATNES
jgi:hypothetical protein